jgi:pimeloyl-ACP methyl ester carboxylesterase
MIPFTADPATFPWRAHAFDTGAGVMRYVDEGQGRAVVLVHGTPTWAFLYRHLIPGLAATHRVIAPDHLGYGRSDKPRDADYRPAAHAARLRALLESLGVEDITLVVHDFGGPIGLSFAVERPDAVRSVVLFNTWLWSLRGTSAASVSRVMATPVGRFLYRRLNFSPRVMFRLGYGDRRRYTRDVLGAYVAPFPTPETRDAPWVLARELGASADWYDDLWRRRDAFADKPALLLWGMKDPAFGPDALARWQGALTRARTVEFPDAGHAVQEEAPAEALPHLAAFVGEGG